MIKILLLSSVILFSQSGYSVSKSWFKESNIQNSYSESKVKLTRLEKRIASNFHKLFKLSKKNELSSRLLRNLLRDMKKSNTFYNYILWPKNILKIKKLKSLAAIGNYCDYLSSSNHKSSIQDYLNKKTFQICLRKYLQTLSRNATRPFNFHKNNINFFSRHISDFSKYQHRIEFEYFLSRFKDKNPLHKFYSNVVTGHYMTNEETPRKSIIRYLDITPKFTRYIQTTRLEIKKIERTFLTEFRKMTREILDYSDKNENKIDATIIYKTQAVLTYLNATYAYHSKRNILKSLIAFGKALTRRGHNKIARNVYLRILDEKTHIRNEVLFELLWTYTNEEDYSGALAMLKKELKPNDDIYSNSKFSFWIGYSKLKNGDKEQANEIFKTLVFKNPLSYYAILSSKILSDERDDMDTKSVYLSLISDHKRSLPIKPIQFDHRWLKRVLAWNDVYNPQLLKLELEAISKSKSGKELEAHLLSAAYKLSTGKNYLESFKIIYRFVEKKKLSVTKDVLRILFPAPFYKQIKNMTKFFDPIIALSLIRQESGFNRFAKSHVGARGLMQLMPQTAKRFKRRVKKKQLYNSKLNISIGTRYFSKLMSLYDGNLVYSLAAYNAGESRVKDWKKRNYVNSEESMLQNIENIPFLETRKYVKLIFRNIFFYKMLTDNSKKKDGNTLNEIYDIHLGFNQ